MKIRTITCHDVCNYGASLQALALQTYLLNNGHDVQIIDYLPQYSIPYKLWDISPASHLYKPSKYFFLVKLFWVARKYFQVRPTFKRKDAFKAFNKKYFHLTQHYNSYAELASNPPEADVYIAGSDQIWRTNLCNGKDPSFYLQFGNRVAKRISYAASFGLPYLTDGMDYLIKTYLSGFDAVSVRESSGLDILNSIGINGTLVTDPVFLLSKVQWLQLLDIRERIIQEKYILVYDLNHLCMQSEKIGYTRKYAQTNGLKIVAVNDINKTPYADININDAGPEEFVNLIANAEFVVSDSFHATAFSCIMKTPFKVFYNSPQAARISDFLNKVGLMECMNNEKNYNIDWEKVNCIMFPWIDQSKCFLNDNINR